MSRMAMHHLVSLRAAWPSPCAPHMFSPLPEAAPSARDEG